MLATLKRMFSRRPPPPDFGDQGAAIDLLERERLITPAEAHALIAGEKLADLYEEIQLGEVGIDAGELEHIEALVRVAELEEAALLIGRLHPALRDFPALLERRLAYLARASTLSHRSAGDARP